MSLNHQWCIIWKCPVSVSNHVWTHSDFPPVCIFKYIRTICLKKHSAFSWERCARKCEHSLSLCSFKCIHSRAMCYISKCNILKCRYLKKEWWSRKCEHSLLSLCCAHSNVSTAGQCVTCYCNIFKCISGGQGSVNRVWLFFKCAFSNVFQICFLELF